MPSLLDKCCSTKLVHICLTDVTTLQNCMLFSAQRICHFLLLHSRRLNVHKAEQHCSSVWLQVETFISNRMYRVNVASTDPRYACCTGKPVRQCLKHRHCKKASFLSLLCATSAHKYIFLKNILYLAHVDNLISTLVSKKYAQPMDSTFVHGSYSSPFWLKLSSSHICVRDEGAKLCNVLQPCKSCRSCFSQGFIEDLLPLCTTLMEAHQYNIISFQSSSHQRNAQKIEGCENAGRLVFFIVVW